MDTRGFVGFVIDGTEKITYNHNDSNPSSLGLNVLHWLRTVNGALETVRGQVRALRVVDPNSSPTAEDVDRLRQFANRNVGERTPDDWYVLLRKTQGDPAAILQAGVIEDSSGFPTDSLFAEWGYLVNLDDETFEVYEGFQQTPHDKGRFATRPSADSSYAPVALVASWPFVALPDDETFGAVDRDDD
jgi:hypothetical protein